VPLVRLAPRALAAEEQERLVPGVREGVDPLGEHGRRVREEVGDELRDRDTEVRDESGDDRLGPTVG
jgi:hypothetical protein